MILQRMIFEMEHRATTLSADADLEIVTAWLNKYLGLAKNHLMTIDALQETIIKEEIIKLDTDRSKTKEFDSLIEELIMR
jgi:hypothetical protein